MKSFYPDPDDLEQLVLKLIRDDITISRLVIGLNGLGLEAGNYFVHLGEVVLRLLDFSREELTDSLYDSYFQLTEKVAHEDNRISREEMDFWVLEIYQELKKIKAEKNPYGYLQD